MVRYGQKKGKMAKHTCCTTDTWFISLDEKEMEATLGKKPNDLKELYLPPLELGVVSFLPGSSVCHKIVSAL